MTSTAPPPTLGQAVEVALRRMKTVWRRHEWTPELIAEYRRVLARVGDPGMVEAALDEVIDATLVNYPPPPGVFAKAADELKAAHRREVPRVPRDEEWPRVDLEAIAADAPPAIRAAIERARARVLTNDEDRED